MMKPRPAPTRIVLVLGILILLAGCGVKNITKDTVLGNNKGILISQVRTNARYLHFLMKEKEWSLRDRLSDTDSVLSGTITVTYDTAQPLWVLAVRSGESYIRAINDQFYHVEPEITYFSIMPQTITYIGDIVVDWHGRDVWIRFVDSEEETVSRAQKEYPWIFEQYPYRKEIPSPELQTVDEFEEMDELRKLKEKRQDNGGSQ